MKGIKIFLNRRAVINKVQEMIGSYCTLSKKTNTTPSHVVPTLMKLSLPLKSYFYSLSTFFQNLFTEVAMMLSFLWVDPPLQLMVSTSRSLSATGKNISILCSDKTSVASASVPDLLHPPEAPFFTDFLLVQEVLPVPCVHAKETACDFGHTAQEWLQNMAPVLF